MGVPPGCEIVEGELAYWCACPSCEYGAIPLLPDENGRLVPSPIGCCIGRGWRCSSRRIREAWQAALAGVELAPNETERRLIAGAIVRDYLGIWRGVRGRDPFKTLLAVAYGLNERRLPPRLVAFAVRELARRRGWPPRTAEGVLRCVR